MTPRIKGSMDINSVRFSTFDGSVNVDVPIRKKMTQKRVLELIEFLAKYGPTDYGVTLLLRN